MQLNCVKRCILSFENQNKDDLIKREDQKKLYHQELMRQIEENKRKKEEESKKLREEKEKEWKEMQQNKNKQTTEKQKSKMMTNFVDCLDLQILKDDQKENGNSLAERRFLAGSEKTKSPSINEETINNHFEFKKSKTHAGTKCVPWDFNTDEKDKDELAKQVELLKK